MNTSTYSSAKSLEQLYTQMQKMEAEALAKNKAREEEIRQIYSDLIARSETGGAAKVAGLAEIEKAKTHAIGSGMQQLISSGLYGTTTAAALPIQVENQAGLNRLKLEDMLQQRTQELKLGQAGFVERIQNPYPDYSLLLQTMMAQSNQSGQQQPTGVWGTSGADPRNKWNYGLSNYGMTGYRPSTLKEQARYSL